MTPEALEAEEVPLWLEVLFVLVAADGTLVSPEVWLLTEQEVAVGLQGVDVLCAATPTEKTRAGKSMNIFKRIPLVNSNVYFLAS